MLDCVFFDSGYCKILKGVNNCKTCKFRKTEKQYYDDQLKAEQSLKQRGLRRCLTMDSNDINIVSVERIKDEQS